MPEIFPDFILCELFDMPCVNNADCKSCTFYKEFLEHEGARKWKSSTAK